MHVVRSDRWRLKYSKYQLTYIIIQIPEKYEKFVGRIMEARVAKQSGRCYTRNPL